MNTPHIDLLLSLGRRLQAASTIIDTCYTQVTEHELPDPFFDGILTEKLMNVYDLLDGTLAFVANLTSDIIQAQTSADMDQLMDDADEILQAVASGTIFTEDPEPVSEPAGSTATSTPGPSPTVLAHGHNHTHTMTPPPHTHPAGDVLTEPSHTHTVNN